MFEDAIIDHIVINVNSRIKMEEFYCTVLGFSVARKIPDMTQLRLGSILIDLVDSTSSQLPRVRNNNIEQFCLCVSPFECHKIQNHFRKNKVRFEPPARRFGASGYGESLYFYDIDENKIELKAL